VGIFARVVRIAPQYLMPTVLILCVIGAYGDNSNLFDVWVMLGSGIAGYLMRKYEYEPAPLVVGLVLGTVMERSLRQTLIISRGEISGLWASPLSAIILLTAIVAAVAPGPLRYFREKLRAKSL
jgi:putative tricarboxylic transport membrane protein